MKILINTEKLTDSPYNARSTFPFYFDENAVTEMVEDIKAGTPTCYLISGYRGAGKSSFVRKVEATTMSKCTKTLFIHLNFTKYKSQTYLLRKLIRALYQSLTNPKNKAVSNSLYEKEGNILEEKRTKVLLERLFDQTFHEVTDNHAQSDETSEEKSVNIDLWLFFGFSLTFLLSLSNLFYRWMSIEKLPTILAMIASFTGSMREAISLNVRASKSTKFTKEFQRKSLYDDEIADFHFNSLLDKFHDNEIKLVFVLDELDKVGVSEVDPLINEMKPYLVSGKASFIVVAGQELFYKYESAQRKDDAVLATLFSRVIHVPLLSIDAFHNMFGELIRKDSVLSSPSQADYRSFVDHLIFESKRVPRRFVNLIREKVNWQDDRSILFEENNAKYKVDSEIINAIRKIDENEVAVKLSGAARDYINMQLFLKCEHILAKGFYDIPFSKDDLRAEESTNQTESQGK